MDLSAYLISRMTGIFLFFLMFLGTALWGLISRKPLVFSQKLFFFIFVPLLVGPLPAIFFDPHVSSRLGSEMWVMGLLVIFCFAILMKTMTGYSVMGTTEKSFRAVVTDSLKRLGEEFTEDMNGIHLKRGGVSLRTSFQLGSGYVRPRNKEARLFLKTLVPFLREESQKAGVEYDPKVFWMFLGFAVMFALIGYMGWKAHVAVLAAQGVHG